MIGYARLVESEQRLTRLSRSCQWKLEGSFWAGLAIIFWVILTPLRPPLGPDIAPLAEWIALGLAGVATLTAMQVKYRLRRKLAEEREKLKSAKPPIPLGLINVLREHGVREFGSMYLYMPMPKRARHKEAWRWLDMLDAKGLIKGEPWHVEAGHVKETVRKSNPGLFEGKPTHFELYRLDWETLSEMMGGDLA